MAVQLRSGKEMSNSRVEKKGKKEKSEQEKEEATGRKNIKSSSELIAETENQGQTEQFGEKCEQKQKEKV